MPANSPHQVINYIHLSTDRLAVVHLHANAFPKSFIFGKDQRLGGVLKVAVQEVGPTSVSWKVGDK